MGGPGKAGKVTYYPSLLPGRLRSTKVRFLADLTCDVGETGIPGVTVVSGRLHGVTDPELADCDTTMPKPMSAQIHWKTNTGLRVRDTYISMAPLASSSAPYSYEFSGPASSTYSYYLQWIHASMTASPLNGMPTTDLQCTAKRGVHRWDFAPSTAGEISFGYPPTVTDATPGSARAGTTNLNVTVDGTEFTPGSSVTFSGAGITVNSTTFISSTQLLVNVDIDTMAPTGARNVKVKTATDAPGMCEGCFIVAPAVTGFTPGAVGQGVQNVNLTLGGAGIEPGTQISFANSGITVNYTIWNSPVSMTANVSVAGNAPTGPTDATVTNPDSTSGTCQACFTVNPAPNPTGAAPALGPGAVARVVHITGSNFQSGATVGITGTGIGINSTTFISSTQIDVNMTVQTYATPGAYDVTLTNPDGGTATCGGCFHVSNPPTVTAISPNVLSRNRSSKNLTVTGTGFVNGAKVTFGTSGIKINSTTFVSSTQLTVNVTTNNSTPFVTVEVIVTNPDGGVGTCNTCFVISSHDQWG